MLLNWTHRLTQLGPAFYTRLSPTPLSAPVWASRNLALLQALDWPDQLLGDPAAWAGNALLAGSDPLATVYSGHQFGMWAGQLGDGRALWLGEAASAQGPQEIQLKGAGRTPYSRMGDGRAVLRSSIREYLCSEAMQGLGIPTTRALCLVASPQPVVREEVETAAVVTRVAPSFLRFGHFEHFASRDQVHALRVLADHAIEHHLPEARDRAMAWQGNVYAAMLDAWFSNARNGTLIMTHPAKYVSEDDAFGQDRVQEYRVLSSELFTLLLEQHGLTLTRLSAQI